jgi:hypothetical protein
MVERWFGMPQREPKIETPNEAGIIGVLELPLSDQTEVWFFTGRTEIGAVLAFGCFENVSEWREAIKYFYFNFKGEVHGYLIEIGRTDEDTAYIVRISAVVSGEKPNQAKLLSIEDWLLESGAMEFVGI